MAKKESGKFLKVKCPRCAHEQVIFGKSASGVKCEKCEKLLVQTTGGKTRVKALVKEILSKF